MAISENEARASFPPAYQGVQRLRRHPRMPELPHLPHLPHKKGILTAATLSAILVVGAAGFFEKHSVKPESTGNIGPGGVILERENFPIGEPLTINFDQEGKPVISLDTDEPDIWTWGADSSGALDNRQYVLVLGPEYKSTIPNGLGRVIIRMGEPENNPDIVFGGVWLKRVNSDRIPVGTDGQVLSPGEAPLYTKADDSMRTILNSAPQEPARV